MFAPDTLREWNSRSGISGFSMRACRNTNAATRPIETAARMSVCAEVQPCCSTPRIVYTASISPAVTSTAPGTSAPSPMPIPGRSATSRVASRAVTMPIGTFTKKIQCQLMRSVRRPPASRPIEPPADATNPYTPIAFACSRGSGNIVTIIPRVTAEAIAPPAPCTNRAAMSISWVCARPHTSEAAVKTPRPHRNTRRLPDEVADAPGQEQQAAERDQVGVHHPGEVVLREVQVVLDGRQRDVHDGRVQHDHQHARAEDVEGNPAVCVGGRRCSYGLRPRYSRKLIAHVAIPLSRFASRSMPRSRAAAAAPA